MRRISWLAWPCYGPPRLSRVKLLRFKYHFLVLCMLLWMHSIPSAAQLPAASWSGTLYEAGGKIIPGAQIDLREHVSGRTYTATTDEHGAFSFPELLPGTYDVRIHWDGKVVAAPWARKIEPGDHLNLPIQMG